MKMLGWLLAACCVFAVGTASDEHVRKTMVRDLEGIRNVYDVDYAFADWKGELFGWDLDVAFEQAVSDVWGMEELSVKKFHRIVRDFVVSMKDYHVNVHFNCTESASLPFAVWSAQGRYFVCWIDEECPKEIGLGDELIRFDGRAVKEVIAELKAMGDYGVEATDEALAAMFLTRRSARSAYAVPQGPVSVVLKPKKAREKTVNLEWEYRPEKVSLDPGQCSGVKSMRACQSVAFGGKKESALRRFVKEYSMTLPLYDHFVKGERNAQENTFALGHREGPLPPLGKVTWKVDESYPFYAYIFEGPRGKKVGYVRIPHYDLWEEDIEFFADIILRFEQQTDMLVIDQLNNPGGFGLLACSLSSMLSTEPTVLPHMQWKLNPSIIHHAVEVIEELDQIVDDLDAKWWLGESFFGHAVSMNLVNQLKSYFQFLVDEWQAGKTVTDSFYFMGIDQLPPHPWAHYSKPVFVLINEQDFSCGDLFPAILQDNDHARLLGKRTAGAGGSVWGMEIPNHFGVDSMSVTVTKVVRLDGSFIETLGVKPHIPIEVTANDMQSEFVDYIKAVKAHLK